MRNAVRIASVISGIALLASAAIFYQAGDGAASGPFQIPSVVEVTFTMPPYVIYPNSQNFKCLARVDAETSLGFTPIRALCYNTDAPSQPPPPPYAPVGHLEFNGIVREDGSLFVALVPCVFIESPATAVRIWLDAQLNKTPGPVSGTVTVRQNTGSNVEQIYCADGTETTGPATITPLLNNQNSDALLIPDQDPPGQLYDTCPDYAELGPSADQAPGLRDPFNPYDYYDVDGDGVIDLPNDINGVILHFAPGGYPPEDIKYDRRLGPGPGVWNLGPPDGVIDLPNDILGVVNSFNPGGCPVP